MFVEILGNRLSRMVIAMYVLVASFNEINMFSFSYRKTKIAIQLAENQSKGYSQKKIKIKKKNLTVRKLFSMRLSFGTKWLGTRYFPHKINNHIISSRFQSIFSNSVFAC